MIKYSFKLTNYEEWLKGFVAELGVKTNDPNFLQIPASLGKGCIFAKNISEHISFIVINVELHDDLSLDRLESDTNGYSIFFNKIGVHSHFEVRADNDSIYDVHGKRNNIFISNPASSLDITYSAGSSVQRLGVLYSEDIAKEHLPKEVIDLLNNYVQRKIRNVDDMLLSIKYTHLLNDLLKCDWEKSLNNINNYVKIFQLTEMALYAFFVTPGDRFKQVKASDIKALQQIEENITHAGMISFPSIAQLAKNACMSPSKLKTLFKSVYGYSLYAYYNKSRMLRASDLMKSRNLSIKEVGYEIGYSNLSQFTAAFKKEFGLTPKEYQKQTIKL